MFSMGKFSSVVLAVFSFLFLHLNTAAPILGQNQISIIIDNNDYEVQRNYLGTGINFLIRRVHHSTNNNVIGTDETSTANFCFKKPKYDIDTETGFVGILTQLEVDTDLTDPITFGLSSNDSYVNKVFRIGPESGILYADSSIDAGLYRFNVTADIAVRKLHAVAQVKVNVRRNTSSINDDDKKLTYVKFILAAICAQPESNIIHDITQQAENVLTGGAGNVNTNEILNPIENQIWNKNYFSEFTFSDIRNLLLDSYNSPSETEGSSIQTSSFAQKHKRRRRAIPPSTLPISTPRAVNAVEPIHSVDYKRLYQESPLEDSMMSGFVIFVVSGATLFFFGSIFYFAYKRIRKCGDYEVDEDAKSDGKSVTKQSDDETVYSTVQSDVKDPSILKVTDITQKRVVDSIEITKQKLCSASQPSVFTIQKSYDERNGVQKNGDDTDDEVFVLDMQQVSVGPVNEYSKKVLHKSNSTSTPTILATLINGQECVPQRSAQTNEDCNGDAVKETSFNEIDSLTPPTDNGPEKQTENDNETQTRPLDCNVIDTLPPLPQEDETNMPDKIDVVTSHPPTEVIS